MLNLNLSDCTNIIDIIKKVYYECNNIKKKLEYVYGSFIISSCIEEYKNLFLLNIKKLLSLLDENNVLFEITKNSNTIIFEENNIILQINDRTEIYEESKTNTIHTESYLLEKWNNVNINYIYVGYKFYLFYYKNEWIICNNESLCMNFKINKLESLRDIQNKLQKIINFDNLNKDLYYSFIYQCNKNENILDDIITGNSKRIIYSMAQKLYTFQITNYEIESENNSEENDLYKLSKTMNLYFSCLDEMLCHLENISIENEINKKISIKGYDIKIIIDGNIFQNILFYNKTYTYLLDNIPNNINKHKFLLYLYQKNKLNELASYFTPYSNEIIHRLNICMKTISKEILNIYHVTRKKKNKTLYNLLPITYKKILYEIHGIYINNKNNNNVLNDNKSISIHNVYHFNKNLNFETLICLFEEREKLFMSDIFTDYLNKDCIYTMTHTKLMFNAE